MASLKGNSNGNRGRPYGMMLLLAFGAALFGVMVLHKFRERRIFNLLINDRDRELVTLQLILQKERDSKKEVKRKLEEMKVKIYSLRTQKMELNNRVLEMQSVIASLKEEQRALESAVEEKQNENQILREKEISSTKENPQITALTELLKQKEAEIEEMKHHLENPVNIWSVSTDDPSNPPVNLTATKTIEGKDKNEAGEGKVEGAIAEDRQLQESTNIKDGENSTRRQEDRSRIGMEGTDKTKVTQEVQFQKLENNRDGDTFTEKGGNGEKNADENQGQKETTRDWKLEKPEAPQDEVLGERNERSTSNSVKMDDNSHGIELLKTENEGGDAKVIDLNDHGATRDQGQGKLEITQDGDGRELGIMPKVGTKLEMQTDGSQNGVGSKVRGQHGYRSKTKVKRWRIISRNRNLEKTGNSEDVSIRSSLESEGQRVALRDGELEKVEIHHDRKTGLKMRDEHAQGHTAVVDEREDGQLEMPDKSKNEELLRMRTDKDDQVALEGKHERVVSNVERSEMATRAVEGSRVRHETDEESPPELLLKPQNPQHAEDLRFKVTSADTDHRVRKEEETLTKDGQFEEPQNSQDGGGLAAASVNNEASKLAANSIQRKLGVVRQPEDQEARIVQKPMDQITEDINDSEKEEDADGNEKQENLEVSLVGEQPEKTVTEGDVSSNPDLEVKEDMAEQEGNDEETEF